MTSERLDEMFKGDSADTCSGKFPLVSMGGRADPSSMRRREARTPIGTRTNLIKVNNIILTNMHILRSIHFPKNKDIFCINISCQFIPSVKVTVVNGK